MCNCDIFNEKDFEDLEELMVFEEEVNRCNCSCYKFKYNIGDIVQHNHHGWTPEVGTINAMVVNELGIFYVTREDPDSHISESDILRVLE